MSYLFIHIATFKRLDWEIILREEKYYLDSFPSFRVVFIRLKRTYLERRNKAEINRLVYGFCQI